MTEVPNQRQESNSSEKRAAKWEALLRKFSNSQKTECKSIPLDIPRAFRTLKQFPTGSSYEGTWDVLGMSGQGIYTFPNGVIYTGEFEDGMFHGKGELRYPNGVCLRGVWKEGEMIERTLIFDEGLEYREVNWEYCKMPDRRFTVEYKYGIKPAGESYQTAEQPTREIPPGHFYTVDGLYEPLNKVVYKIDAPKHIERAPKTLEQKWIVDNCRTMPDLPLGPRPDLYETWTQPEPELPQQTIPDLLSRTKSMVLSALSFNDDDNLDEDYWRSDQRISSLKWGGKQTMIYDSSTSL